MTETPTPTRKPLPIRLLIEIAISALLVLLLIVVFAALVSTSGRLNASVLNAKQQHAMYLGERDGNRELAGRLLSCSDAYTDQKDVTDDLRTTVQDSFSRLSNYLGTFGTGDLVSQDLIDRIDAINTRENAIDASACDQS